MKQKIAKAKNNKQEENVIKLIEKSSGLNFLIQIVKGKIKKQNIANFGFLIINRFYST